MKQTAHKKHLHLHESAPIGYALLITSDTRTEKTDLTGKTILKIMEKHNCVSKEIVRNDLSLIRNKVKRLINDSKIRLVITSGGTGCSKKDVSIEAVTPLLKKKLDGFGELFRMLSYKEIGASAIMSRAVLGVTGNNKLICSLPGSTNAVKLALSKLLVPELAHIMWELDR
jgi:molybdenum cofactor biosynthesis protein B